MGVCVGDLQPRQVERLRAELAEALAANFAYPPFFAYPTGASSCRPIDREKRDEISQYLNSVSFSPLDRADVRSPEVRRFLERILSRYIEVNPTLGRARFARRVPELRASVPRIAGAIQRGLVELTEGGAPNFGARRESRSWSGQMRRSAPLPDEEQEYNTGVLQATLTRAHQNPASSVERYPTSPMPAAGPAVAGGPAAPRPNGHQDPTAPRELSPDLYTLYGDYLTDMHPAVTEHAQPAVSSLHASGGYMAPSAPSAGGAWSGAASPFVVSAPPPSSQGSRQDEVIFAQLRYQVEAYVRRAARSYGLPVREGDPARVMDALRHSGMVDEADLRIAEGILALTDRVAVQGHASIEDYRQAFMLYLLYHRSHLGA